MQRMNIPLGGISNVPDDNYSQDGDMLVLVNMRSEGGELSVMCEPESDVVPNVKKIVYAKYHAASDTWIEVRELNDGTVYVGHGTGAIEKKIYIPKEDETITGIEIMGNIIILYREEQSKAAKPIYIQWVGGEAPFKVLGTFPEVPELTLSVTEGYKTEDTIQEYYDGKYEIENPDNDLLWENTSKGFFDKCLAALYGDAMFVDRTLLRVAFKLFDGSVIEHSKIYYVESDRNMLPIDGVTSEDYYIKHVGDDSYNFHEVRYDDSGSKSRYKVAIKGFSIDIGLKDFEDLTAWEDIILGIEVYATPSIMGHIADNKAKYLGSKFIKEDYVRDSISIYTSVAYERYRPLSGGEIVDAIESADLFYKIKEFALSGEEVWKIKNTSPSEMSVQDRLNNNEMPHVVLPVGNISTYNSKMHVPGVNEVLHLPYGVGTRTVTNESITIEHANQISAIVKIQTDSGVRTVVNNFYDVPVETGEDLIFVSKYISYPDSRAKEMEVIACIGKGALRSWYRGTFKLKAHNTLNLAFSVGAAKGIAGLGTGVYGNAVPMWANTNVSSDIVSWIYDDGTFEINSSYAKNYNVYTRKDTLKVSAVGNPFFFPAAQTYKYDGDIVGVASNAEAISTGQFGQYPLFVFTDRGIWAMSVDGSGKGAYTAMSPFSREVCCGAICPVSGGVVFATERGVMVISGGQVSELSELITGNGVDMVGSELYTKIMHKAAAEWNITLDNIRKYIKGAVIAYNYLHDEVIISNPNKGYSYVYGLKSQRWSVTDTVFNFVTNCYPELVVYEGNKRLKFTDRDLETAVCGITRPVKLGSVGYKRIRQAALRGTFRGALGFYVMGSDDGVIFEGITGREIAEVATRRDLITPRARSKMYRFFAFAFAGKMKGRLSLVELLAEGAFADNKIR